MAYGHLKSSNGVDKVDFCDFGMDCDGDGPIPLALVFTATASDGRRKPPPLVLVDKFGSFDIVKEGAQYCLVMWQGSENATFTAARV